MSSVPTSAVSAAAVSRFDRRTHSARADDARPIEVRRLGRVDYVEAWELQRALATARADGAGPDTMLLLEHPPVYTAGRRTTDDLRPTDGTPVIDVDRGGLITWHGPGQLVGYPLVALAEPVDVVDYVRRLEEALIAVVTAWGVECGRVEGRSGVWVGAGERDGVPVPERKIAAIGIRVQRGVTQHGFALNCDADLSAFDAIVPCGIRDAGVTSLSLELGRVVTIDEVADAVESAVLDAIEGRTPVSDHPVAASGPGRVVARAEVPAPSGDGTVMTTVRY